MQQENTGLHPDSRLNRKAGNCRSKPKSDEQTSSSNSNKLVPFPLLLHSMLDDATTHEFEDIVSWQLDGYAFKVVEKQAFVEKILPKYFNQASYKSFLRQVNLYGFSRISKSQAKGGHAGGCYFHKHFIRGQKQLCAQIARQAGKKALSESNETPSPRPNIPRIGKEKVEKGTASKFDGGDGDDFDSDSSEKQVSIGQFANSDLLRHIGSSSIPNALAANLPQHDNFIRRHDALPVADRTHSQSDNRINPTVFTRFNQQTTNNVTHPAISSCDPQQLNEALIRSTLASTSNSDDTVLKDPSNAPAASLSTQTPKIELDAFYESLLFHPNELDSAKNLLESVDLFKQGDDSSSEEVLETEEV